MEDKIKRIRLWYSLDCFYQRVNNWVTSLSFFYKLIKRGKWVNSIQKFFKKYWYKLTSKKNYQQYKYKEGIQKESEIFKKMKIFRDKKKYPNSEYLSNNGLYLPSGLGIKNYEINYVCKVLNKILG